MTTYPSKKKYDKENVFRVAVAFNRKTDPEMTEFIEGKENRPEYIRGLVRDDMRREKGKK